MRNTGPMTKDGHQHPMPKTLADLRRARGLTITQVADRMDVSRQHVTNIEARFPNLNYDTVSRYLAAIDGRIQFQAGDARAYADELIPDPDKKGTREYRAARKGMGDLVYVPSRPAEELPLEEGEPGPGSDDTGREVDQPNPQSDQADREDGQQP